MTAPTTDITLRAFGRDVTLTVAENAAEITRRQTEIDEIYARALASRSLPRAGLCVDLGAGEGWFGLSFAAAFPAWQVICLEPDAQAFDRLKDNAAALKLSNVICVQAALHPDVATSETPARAPEDLPLSKALTEALNNTQPAEFVTLAGLAPRVAPADTDTPLPARTSHPALPIDLLAALVPDVIKLDAPDCEAAIGTALKTIPVGLILGPLYSYVPSAVFAPAPEAGPREFYLPHRKHALRRDYEDNFDTRQPGLDIVVAMYNTTEFIVECVDSLLAGDDDNVTVLVVDDGSTDGCGDLVETHYKDQPRVRLLRKANGGCASARNYGRMHSTATHIAFLDADDRVDAGMFTALFETARYTGAPVVEGEFEFFTTDEDGTETLTPSYEAELYDKPGDNAVGPYAFRWIRGRDICFGQPTIWRRVHRRDWLDRRNIWFPEHIRAFDDQIFQFLVGEYSGSIAHVQGYNYHYRQHAAQDIKQGDERHFYSFNMYRAMAMRAIEESWNDLEPLMASLLNTMAWSYSGLRPDLKPLYQKAASEFLAILSKTLGHQFTTEDLERTGVDGLEHLLRHDLDKMRNDAVNYGFIRLESWRWQPEFIRMQQRLSASG